MREPIEIIDISQPVSSQTACFPGDVPFSSEVTVTHDASGVLNLTAFTMSPHVGTHADAPVHIHGQLNAPGPRTETIGQLALEPFVGPVIVVDVSPCTTAIEWKHVAQQLEGCKPFPKRVLFKTSEALRPDVFEDAYAYFSTELVENLAQRGVILVGLDTPSVDPVDSKTLDAHHCLLKAGMAWLENLDLSRVPLYPGKPETYFLSALPLKLMELEASPVRAVLLRF